MEPQIYIAPGPFELETGHTLPDIAVSNDQQTFTTKARWQRAQWALV